MPHDPKLVAAIEAAIIAAIQEHDMSDSQLYWMGGPEPSQERSIIATAALDAIEAMGCEILHRPKVEAPVVLAVGQRWVPTSAKAKPRIITKIGAHRSYPWAGETVVYFEVEGEPARERPRALTDETFKAWAKARGAMVAARPGAKP